MIDFGFSNIIEEKTLIKDIPMIVLTPKNMDSDIATIVLYHGWSSNKENQRIRGFILASAGYRVVIPDTINHGERNPLDEYGVDKGVEFIESVYNSIDEWDILIDGLVEEWGVCKDRIGVIGNSMGGIIAGAIYTQNNYIKALVVLNGTMAWGNTMGIVMDELNIHLPGILEKAKEKLEDTDPIKNIDLLVDRPILLLHGDADSVISVESERKFFKHLSPEYTDKERIEFIEYEGLNHIVSTNMMEESILFFNKFLKYK